MAFLTTTDSIHWQTTAIAPPVCDTLVGDQTADVVIVGAGLTGLRTAVGLAESGATVVVLEAKEVGFGASGRSGGQCNPMWRATPDALRKRLGFACADRLIETTLGSADALFADIAKYDVDCDPEQDGWVQAAHCKAAQRGLEQLAAAWNADGAQISSMDRTETERVSGSPAYGFALFHPRGGHVQPLSLTRGYAKAAQKLSATIYERSPVVSMDRSGGTWTVKTPDGFIKAPQVILTTNAYTDKLWPDLKETFLPLTSVSLATLPLTAAQQETVLPAASNIADTRRAIYYSRLDRDRRLVFGCVGSGDSSQRMGGFSRLMRGLRTVFPQLEGIGIERTWSGRIAVTPEMMPHLHEPAPGVLAAVGFSGRGIAMTSVMGRTLTRKAMGASDDTLPFPVTKIVPIPMHWAVNTALPLAAPAMTVRDRIDTLIDPL